MKKTNAPVPKKQKINFICLNVFDSINVIYYFVVFLSYDIHPTIKSKQDR